MMETTTLPRAAALALARYAKGEIDYWEGKKRSGLPYGVWLNLVLDAGLPGVEIDWDDEEIAHELEAIDAMKEKRARGDYDRI